MKISLEKGKEIENNWDSNKLSLLINNCINIENNIKEIKLLNQSIEKVRDFSPYIKFYPAEWGINKLLDSIKIFGKIKDIIFDSKINLDEKLVKSWLNNREFKTELLYRKSSDGSTPNDFHKRCDNKGITITFIETTKGYKFGGYTEVPWDKSGKSKKNKSMFLFSLNNKLKATNNNSQTNCANEEGPIFDLGFIEINLNKTLDKGESFNKSFFLKGMEGIEALTNGDKNWDVKELEVHKIIYI